VSTDCGSGPVDFQTCHSSDRQHILNRAGLKHMIKQSLKSGARKLGINLTNTERLGVDLELDLARFAAGIPIATIFDVGGNFGQTATRFALAFPTATIFTFEPVPTSFERLVKAVEHNDRIKAFNIALGETAGSVSMNLTHHAGSNSILENPSAIGKIDVQSDTVDSVAHQNGVETIDLLKIDVEGYELQVLKGAGKLLSEGRIRFVFAECVFSPDTEAPHTSFFDLHQALDRVGFCFVTYYAQSFGLRLGCALGNVLYALRSTLPEHAQGSLRNIV
ncbi:MAG: FkbM family methyltransferase, partial [Pyrinomonadaceae bacterium]